MSTSPDPVVPRTRLWLRLAFGASLALNLLVIGLVAGTAFRYGGKDGMRPPPSSFGATMYRQLSRDDRRALRAAMKNGGPKDQFARRKSEAQAIGAALRADPFDADAVETLLEGQASQRRDWQMSVQTAWMARLEKMSPAERTAYADRLEQALISPRKSRHHKDRDRD